MVNLMRSKPAGDSGYYSNQAVKNPEPPKRGYNLTLVLFVVLVLSLLLFLAYFKSDEPAAENPVVSTKPAEKTEKIASSSSALPENLSFGQDDPYGLGSSTLNLKAEELSFGLFYEKPQDDFRSVLKPYALPINIKSDVRNYFTMARTFDLDPLIPELNEHGFTVVNSSYFTPKTNFFDIYRYFILNDAPLYFSADFVIYNFQKSLNDVYKDVEENIFYENFWEINRYLYNLALTRYMETYSRLGDVNDVILEGQRLELVFFAVALKLLEAEENQINRRANFTDPAKFTPQEFDYFSLNIPDFIASDVEKELKLIQAARGRQKSPVLLYERDYSKFQVPKNYNRKAKLKNYYLARQWFNSNFPLFYQGDLCPDCLLDENDWLINMLAASLIAQDINSSQEIKNKWAEIYKFISYFSGLRQDLTYLHYIDAYTSLFGPEYDLEKIFSDSNSRRNEDLKSLAKYLLEIDFDQVNGGIDRNSSVIDPKIGMKILQDYYWPNAYLFGRITGQDLSYERPAEVLGKPITNCGDGKKYRCRGVVYDLLDLRSPITDNVYLESNRQYPGLPAKISSLRFDLDKFDKFSWNANIYWSTLDWLKSYLDYEASAWPAYMQGRKWRDEKVLNTAAAAWVNMQLEDDKLLNYFEVQEKNNFSSFRECNLGNFLEPAPALYADLSARTEMLAKMIFMLKIPKKTNAASLELKDLQEKMDTLTDISKRELQGETINGDECSFLNSLAMQYYVDEVSGKAITLDFPEQDLAVKISGMNIIVTVNRVNGDKILNFGPIFKFQEELR